MSLLQWRLLYSDKKGGMKPWTFGHGNSSKNKELTRTRRAIYARATRVSTEAMRIRKGRAVKSNVGSR